MILTGVEVSGIGRFREGVRLVGLGPGVNVLAAANEAGKSTLFRAVRACFFQRHTSSQSELTRLGTDEADLPARVAVTFQHRGRDYRIEKRFLRQARASLSEGGRLVAEGRQADDRLWDLLGLRQTRLGVEDEAAFGLLWVGQTGSFRLDPPSAGAAHLLGGLIASEIGAVVGGERARAVLERVEAALGALETPKERKPKAGGPWAAALRRRDDLRVQEAELRRRLGLLDEDVQSLAGLQAEFGRLSDPSLRARLEAELRTAEAAQAEAERSAERLTRHRAEAEAATGRRRALEESLRHLRDAAGRIEAARASIGRLEQALGQGEAEIAAAGERLTAAEARLTAAEAGLAALAQGAEALARLERAAEAAEGLEDLVARRDEARLAAEHLHAIDAECEAIRATPDLVKAVDELAREVVRRRAAREAGAARLTLALGPEAGEAVLIDGAPAGADLSRPVLGVTRISVGRLATITVTPAGDEAGPALAAAERELAAALARTGTAAPEEARAALTRRGLLDQERAALQRQLRALLPGASGESGLDVLEGRIARANLLVRTALREARLAYLPDREALSRRRQEIGAGEAAARRERDSAAGAHEAARGVLQRLRGARSAEAARLEAERGALAQALAAAPDGMRDAELARLAAALDQARAEEAAAREGAARLERAAPSAEALAQGRARVERLAQALANHDLRRTDLDKRIHALEVGIERDGGAGLGEEHAAAAAELDMAEREVRRREDEVAALRLLRDTIQASLAESRARYLAPVRQHLRPFLADVFPDGELDLAEDYTPRGLTRAGRPERHDLLSDGTREQIAVLVRLALGSLLAERGEPVPVILDDALVFSDDARIDRMFDALSRAGQRHQVIVLTCRTRAFASLGGRILGVERLPE